MRRCTTSPCSSATTPSTSATWRPGACRLGPPRADVDRPLLLPCRSGLGRTVRRARPADQLAEFGIWGTASLRWELFPTGFARVVGWTDSLPPPVEPGDDTSARTAVSSLVPIDPAGQPVGAATVRAAVVRTPFGPFGRGGGGGQQHRSYATSCRPARRPTGWSLAELELSDLASVAFWDGRAWTEVDVPDDGSDVDVPAAAVRGGAVLMRGLPGGMGDPSFLPVLAAAP